MLSNTLPFIRDTVTYSLSLFLSLFRSFSLTLFLSICIFLEFGLILLIQTGSGHRLGSITSDKPGPDALRLHQGWQGPLEYWHYLILPKVAKSKR